MDEHVVVVGGGLMGAAIAAEVSRSAKVIVVDSQQPGCGTSGATFSWVNSSGKKPRSYHDLNVDGMIAHRKLLAENPGADWYFQNGAIAWGSTLTQREALTDKVSGLQHWGYAAQWLTKRQLLELEPDVASGVVPEDGIAFFPEEGWIYPSRLIGFLLRRAKSHGAVVISDDAVVDFSGDGRRIRTVKLGSGKTIAVRAVVDAAGTSAGKIAELAGVHLPMRAVPGVLTYLRPSAVDIRHVMHTPQINMRPDGGGRLVIRHPSADTSATYSQHEGWTVPADVAVSQLLAATAIYPGLAGVEVDETRVGVRPIPLDEKPVLGRTKGIDNFFCAVTHSAATLCLRFAELVAPEVLEDGEAPELAEYRQERFTTSIPTE